MGILIPRRTWLGGALGAFAATLTSGARASGLVVVVHESIDQDSFSKQELAAIFTTKKRNYSGGQRIIALNLPPRSAERISFDQSVLNMNPDEVARYWIDRKVRGGDPPPKHVPSVAMMAKLVEKLPGTIGYLPAGAARGLRVVAQI